MNHKDLRSKGKSTWYTNSRRQCIASNNRPQHGSQGSIHTSLKVDLGEAKTSEPCTSKGKVMVFSFFVCMQMI